MTRGRKTAAPLHEGGRFEGLARYLSALPAEEGRTWLTLNDIERLLAAPLPAAARRASYWTSRRAYARATWLREGFTARLDRRADAVCFTRQTNAGADDDRSEEQRGPAAADEQANEAAAIIERGKYAPLIRLLEVTPPEQEMVQLTTAEIEAILGEPLPASALRPGFWSSPGLNASRAWKRLGFVVRLDRDLGRVLFIRKAA